MLWPFDALEELDGRGESDLTPHGYTVYGDEREYCGWRLTVMVAQLDESVDMCCSLRKVELLSLPQAWEKTPTRPTYRCRNKGISFEWEA